MKRASDDLSTHKFESQSQFAGPSGSQLQQHQPKRQKSSHACSSCRKHKTRCEQIDGHASGSQRCHRCNVLNMQCSFDLTPPTGPPMIQASASVSKESPSTPGRQIMIDFASPPESPRTVTHGMNPEDIVPAPITPWTSRQGPAKFDWMATPMLALQELARRPNPAHQPPYVNQASLSLIDIITPDQLLYLLEIFDSRFSLWLEIPPIRDVHTPLLDLVRCNIASRHLDLVTRSVVAPRLQKLTEEAVFREMFNPVPSIEAIHAILILSFWQPIPCTPQCEMRDGRLLVASAVSMALNLRLNQVSDYVVALQNRKKLQNGLSAAHAQDLMEATEKAHSWICLSNVEAMLCVGTGRQPLSYRSDADIAFINSCISGVEAGRDIRLGLMSQLFDLADRGYRIHFARYSEMDKWHKDVLDILMRLEGLHRIMLPFPVVAEQDAFQYHMMLFYYHFCRLLVLHQAIREARRVLQEHYPGKPWHKEFVHQGINLAMLWGQEAISTAEAVLVAHLSRPENITSAPDIVFTMVSFSAVWLIIAKFARYQARGEHLPGASDALLTKVIERLSQSALTPEHTPAKCAQVISASFKAYATSTSLPSNDSQEAIRGRVGHTISAERLSTSRHTASDCSGSSATEATQILNFELNTFMNSEIFLDTTFWSSFMSNLSTQSL